MSARINVSKLVSTLHVHNASWQSELACWQGDESSLVPLTLPQTQWLAVHAVVELLDGPPGVTLVFTCAEGNYEYALPMSLKGHINEVVAVPDGATAVAVKPLLKPGRFIIHSISLQALSPVKRLWRMWRRLAMYFTTTTVTERQQAAISLTLLLHGVTTVYQRIGALKACARELDYGVWLSRFDTPTEKQIASLNTALKQWQRPDSIAVLVYPQQGSNFADVDCSIQSVKQLYQHAAPALFVLADEGETAQKLAQLSAQLGRFEHVLLLPAGARLSKAALGWLLAPAYSAYSLCYSDHDEVGDNGERCNPRFKPAWNPELSRTSHYIGGVLRIKPAWLLASGWLEAYQQQGSYGLLLALEPKCNDATVGHIPALLYHQRQSLPVLPDAVLLQRHLKSQGIAASVRLNPFSLLDIHYHPSPDLPLVSIIVPTRNMLHLLKPCIESLLHSTDYAAMEILIVDNQSDDTATLSYMRQVTADARVKVLRFDAPFNYSAINNYAVAQASGELVCLLNNDTKVINPDWLVQMVGQLQQPGVGAVGARLLFADNHVQHAGDAIGIGGCAAHMHFRLPSDAPGYMARAVVSQDLSAVTAACLLTPRSLYLQLGGLNERDLTVAFNDVDYCLKVREAGKRVVYTPLAQLYHYESVSRGKDDNPVKRRRAAAEAAYMRQRWPQLNRIDPYYNPNLNALSPDFRLSAAPAVEVPW